MGTLSEYTKAIVMYHHVSEKTILIDLANYLDDNDVNGITKEIHKLLELATRYGFKDNLWKSYVTFLLALDENPFSVLCEIVGAADDASANIIVKKDMDIFYRIFNYDFSTVEDESLREYFSILCNYKSMHKDVNTFNKSVSDKVYFLMKELENATDGGAFFDTVTAFYKKYGVGKLGLNKAFRVVGEGQSSQIEAITHTSDVKLDDLIGYEIQKEKLVENTEAFVLGKPANNCLLFGDAGTGKSTCIKAILNMYYDRGLRLIELYKHQLKELPKLVQTVKNRNYRFIIYMDDLSFEEFETDYKYLKAVIEGGMEVRPDNVLIYATSNRRHLIRETWSDRSDMSDDELHRSDTMQEKLSLSARFGVSINFDKPQKKLFDDIVIGIARQENVSLTDEELIAGANVWALRNGGYSGRIARQYVTNLLSQQ
ncbi:MAG: ATP-binding protein [Eubacterium sp.]|nr:ATP-binding protein [Eubacterium sp.]